MPLADRVRVSRRFRRAVRIDADLRDPAALEGFLCPQSSADVLENMARHAAENGQGAFTWTGPYGGGKSSLVVALSAALNGNEAVRGRAAEALGNETAALLAEALPPRKSGWRTLPVVGRRGRPEQVIGEALVKSRLLRGRIPRRWTEQGVLDALSRIAARNPRNCGGLVVFLDEMGKFLEAAARGEADIHLFQQMAELASRSNRRLIVVGILHQAFAEYAHRLSREMRGEWSKIQGRFVDLVVNAAPDEQIDILSRAVENQNVRRTKRLEKLAAGAAELASGQPDSVLADYLQECRPLHPLVSCLLGPVSRRRFGQNQRSIFGFLNSAEPQGFQDFLRGADGGDLYGPERLWDYLRVNLEPSILASPDGYRWALAADALRRCQDKGGGALHLRLLKTVALADMLKDRSGLPASPRLLRLALPDCSPPQIEKTLERLQQWRLIEFRKYEGAWAVFEGSDFDIDRAVEQARAETDETDFASLNALAGLQPVVAKRHYHETGALRWFDVGIVPLSGLEDAAAREPSRGALGSFFLAVPAQGETQAEAEAICRAVVRRNREWDIMVGTSRHGRSIPELTAELAAFERVRDETPELQGDRVAREQVRARVADAQAKLESELTRAFDGALWRSSLAPDAKPLSPAARNAIASDLADARFSQAPRLPNELLCRVKPSSSAAAARNALLRRMVGNEGEPRLGIEGFPAEGGLFDSLLDAAGLYRETPAGLRFAPPPPPPPHNRNLSPAWRAAEKYLQDNANRALPIAEIYDVWRRPPYGVKDGLLPVLAVAFLLSQRENLAFYRQGVFQAGVADLDIDYLVNDPADVQLRWMNLDDEARRLLSGLASAVRALDETNALRNLEPIDVARGLVAIHDRLPPWTGRTQRLSGAAKRIRRLFKQANDPNRLIFDDLPSVLDGETPDGSAPGGEKETARRIVTRVREGLEELQQAYPRMLARMKEMLLAELQVPNGSPAMLAELRGRAANVRGLAGDNRLEAFVVRLAQFKGSGEDLQGLASMAVNKPPAAWVDADIDRAAIELAAMAQRFLRAETFARVKGRPDKRHALAVVVGIDGRPTPLSGEFDLADRDRPKVRALRDRIDAALRGAGEAPRNVVLAALAELSARYLTDAAEPADREGAAP